MKPIRAIDVCAGAGGWVCAARGLPIQVVLAVDLWEPACRTYALNNPGTDVRCADLRDADVRAAIVKDYGGAVDLIVGGIPCEWISVYRTLQKVSEEEREAERNTLDSVLDLVRELGARWWCLEDVKGLARELPIFTPYVEIDAARYSPQRRKRIYVGTFPMPAPGRCRQTLKDRLRPGPYRIGRRCHDREPVRHRTFNRKTCLAAELDRKAPTVCAISSRRDAELAVVDPALPGGKRQLEWQEAARLQGFPEDYVFWGSPTDVGSMVGRAIQIDTGRAILEAICREALKR